MQLILYWQDRPLSARERRRLRQSQESVGNTGSESKTRRMDLTEHPLTLTHWFSASLCTAVCVAPQSSYEIHASTQGDLCSDPVSRSLTDVVPESCREVLASLHCYKSLEFVQKFRQITVTV